MTRSLFLLPIILAAFLVSSNHTNAESISMGGDVFTGGSSTTMQIDSPRDAFAYGFSVSMAGSIAQDAHAAGFDVEIDSTVGEDLYAAGASVTVGGPVRQDVTISGFSVRTKDSSTIGGNARIAAGTMVLEAPIEGSLLATAGNITLNAPVKGDVRLMAAEVEFGEKAKIDGRLTYSAPAQIDIPASVISPDRVTFQPLDRQSMMTTFQKNVDESIPGFWPSFLGMVGAFLVSLAFLLIVAMACLSFFPDTVERMRERIVMRPGLAALFGFLGLSMIIGLVPASAITIVGLPLIPIAILLAIVLWILGYLLGAYTISLRLWQAFGPVGTSLGRKLLVILAGLVVLAILNFIPFLGWLINLAIVFLGLGSICMTIVGRILARSGDRFAIDGGPASPLPKADGETA